MLETWPAALDYWNKVAQSAEVSDDFQGIAREATDALHRIRDIAVG